MHFEYTCTSWKHFGLQTHCLLLQRAEHPLSPMVFFWAQSPSEGRLCSWQKLFISCSYEQRLLLFSNCLPGTLCPVKTGGEFNSFSRKKIKPIVNHFQHKYMSLPSGRSISGHSLDLPQSTAYLCTFSCQSHATFN